MAEQLGTLSPERERPSPEFRTAKRRPPRPRQPGPAVARPPIHRPQWLLHALRQRGLQPSDERPMHRLLSERDLPSDCEEHEKVVVTGTHKLLEEELAYVLRSRYKGQNVFVGADLMVYFDGHNPSRTTARRLGPDLMVALDLSPGVRDTYAVWEEGKAPDFVLELLSKSTWEKDVMRKPALYRRMGVREYFLFDPNDLIVPRLWGWRFQDGRAARVPYTMVTSGMAGLYSETLNLNLCHTQPWPDVAYDLPEAGKLRWHDPDTDELLETQEEMRQQNIQFAQRDKEQAQQIEQQGQQLREQGQQIEEQGQQIEEQAQRIEALEVRLAAAEGRSPR